MRRSSLCDDGEYLLLDKGKSASPFLFVSMLTMHYHQVISKLHTRCAHLMRPSFARQMNAVNVANSIQGLPQYGLLWNMRLGS